MFLPESKGVVNDGRPCANHLEESLHVLDSGGEVYYV